MLEIPKTVLIAEDNPDDVLLFDKACEKYKAGFLRQFVKDGGAAIAYLNGVGKFADRTRYPIPALMILDITMPGLSGFDVLRWIRLDENLKTLPVIIFSSSSFRNDIATAYETGANSYLVKPIGDPAFLEILGSICNFWLKINRTPETRAPFSMSGNS